MKTRNHTVLLIIGLQLAFAQSASGQKLIKIDESLKVNSQQVRAKRKGISSVGKYEFGNYKVISGKGGWETTTSKSPLFSDNSSIKSSSKKSFVFVHEKGDTAIANISVVKHIWLGNSSISPTLATIDATQRTDLGKVIYANSITLTPGTVAVGLVGDRIIIHALSKENIDTLKAGKMDRRVTELENRC